MRLTPRGSAWITTTQRLRYHAQLPFPTWQCATDLGPRADEGTSIYAYRAICRFAPHRLQTLFFEYLDFRKRVIIRINFPKTLELLVIRHFINHTRTLEYRDSGRIWSSSWIGKIRRNIRRPCKFLNFQADQIHLATGLYCYIIVDHSGDVTYVLVVLLLFPRIKAWCLHQTLRNAENPVSNFPSGYDADHNFSHD